ncbi:MAG TPA: FAA hydrolase family protein [Flavobacteriales bacterium]|nr:FAA hydrolase family protein [Flavobacteriales bacterium]HIA11896.1 FAA hydrolase family protein [Flavobacteriales bacterium]
MKIICIGRNYSEHAKELNNPIPEEPVIFLKPDTALIHKNEPFFLPHHSSEIHHEVELVIKIVRLGKNIAENFAHKYFAEIGIGIDFTARDVQQEHKTKGLPWEKAKAFDGSAPLGSFLSKNSFDNINGLDFRLEKNGEIVQQGNSKDMLFSFDQIIAHVSRYFTLKIGDLIYTGTPAGVGKVVKDDLLECFIQDQKLLSFRVK